MVKLFNANILPAMHCLPPEQREGPPTRRLELWAERAGFYLCFYTLMGNLPTLLHKVGLNRVLWGHY